MPYDEKICAENSINFLTKENVDHKTDNEKMENISMYIITDINRTIFTQQLNNNKFTTNTIVDDKKNKSRYFDTLIEEKVDNKNTRDTSTSMMMMTSSSSLDDENVIDQIDENKNKNHKNRRKFYLRNFNSIYSSDKVLGIQFYYTEINRTIKNEFDIVGKFRYLDKCKSIIDYCYS